MLSIFCDRRMGIEPSPSAERLAQAIWIDAQNPTPDEKAEIERETGLYVSSQAELSEIESSARFFEEDGAIYLSLPVFGVEGEFGISAPLGLVLTPKRLLTIRFATLGYFEAVAARLTQRNGAPKNSTVPSSALLFLSLLEALVEAMADMLERIRGELDGVSNDIFRRHAPGPGQGNSAAELQKALQTMGRVNDRISRIRDSLLVFNRVIPYVSQSTTSWFPKDLRPRLDSLRQDVVSLSDYDAHLVLKLQFLLDAVLGFISINQSNIIKVMTVVGVIGVPPTLIASIYGMNFVVMPELHWAWGYPAALLLILLSAVVPILWFRRRGWL
jgi:magnesium transporter